MNVINTSYSRPSMRFYYTPYPSPLFPTLPPSHSTSFPPPSTYPTPPPHTPLVSGPTDVPPISTATLYRRVTCSKLTDFKRCLFFLTLLFYLGEYVLRSLMLSHPRRNLSVHPQGRRPRSLHGSPSGWAHGVPQLERTLLFERRVFLGDGADSKETNKSKMPVHPLPSPLDGSSKSLSLDGLVKEDLSVAEVRGGDVSGPVTSFLTNRNRKSHLPRPRFVSRKKRGSF